MKQLKEEIEANLKGRKWVIKYLRKKYRERDKPVWFFSIMDLEELENL